MLYNCKDVWGLHFLSLLSMICLYPWFTCRRARFRVRWDEISVHLCHVVYFKWFSSQFLNLCMTDFVLLGWGLSWNTWGKREEKFEGFVTWPAYQRTVRNCSALLSLLSTMHIFMISPQREMWGEWIRSLEYIYNLFNWSCQQIIFVDWQLCF